MTDLSFHECCRIILEHTTTKFWAAKSYARHGLLIDPNDSHAVRSQAMYLLSNLAQWRGERPREVKAWLRLYAGRQDAWLGGGAQFGKTSQFGKGRGKSGVK